MATVTSPPASQEIDYPDSDGQPMAETAIHRQNLTDLIEMLEDWFAADSMVYVSGNMFLYYVEGVPAKNVAPDVFVVRGVDKDKELRRRTFKVWVEGHAPDLIIELTSASTREEDKERKFALYQDVLAVTEYVLFDPERDWLDPPLQGFRLVEGVYRPIEPVEGRLPSEVLGLRLGREGDFLRLYDPATGRRLPTRGEALAIKDAELATKHAELAAMNAENERLRRELEALRRQLPTDVSPS
jgi:Uma2 family endonuclease